MNLTFAVAGRAGSVTLADPTVVVAGYTGSDVEAVKHHIEELAAIGVKPPESVPSFYLMDQESLTQKSEIEVAGSYTSGEVEPVLLRINDRFYLGVGSDHTDRDMERDSVRDSKRACPKPICSQVFPLGESTRWDQIEVSSEVDGILYQKGFMNALRVPTDVFDMFCTGFPQVRGDVVMLCGTWPLLNGTFIAGTIWKLSLRVPNSHSLTHLYRVSVRGTP